MTEHTVSNVLQEGRRLLAAGWMQGWYCSGDEQGGWRYCILGALNQARKQLTGEITEDGEVEVVDWEAEQALIAHLPNAYDCLDDFNDAEDTTQKRVLALFDRTLMDVTK